MARVVVGRPPDDLGAASQSAPATAGAIALISGHALHLVVRLVLEKSAGSHALPVWITLRNFSKRGGTGITNRRPTSKSHGGANRQRRPALFAALPGAAPGCSPTPEVQKTSSISAAQLTAPCPYPFDLPPSRSVTVPVEAEARHDDRTRVRKDDGRRRSGIGRWPRIGRQERRRHTGCRRPPGTARWPRPTRRSWPVGGAFECSSRRTRSRSCPGCPFDLRGRGASELSVKSSSGEGVLGSDRLRWFRQVDVHATDRYEELFRRPYRECEDARDGTIQRAVLLPLQAYADAIGSGGNRSDTAATGSGAVATTLMVCQIEQTGRKDIWEPHLARKPRGCGMHGFNISRRYDP